MMRHGSLFSGIGGFDLAAEWMGWENVFHCEWNPFGQKVLNHYWPKAECFTDITKSDFTKYNGTIDIISGGFPCQPYSAAGKRKGKEDERHLWPEMLRAIREISPRWVVGENVRGLTNWNGGMVFDEVQADLEFEGYEVTPFLLPAVAVNAPHRRDRIWFVAYSDSRGVKQGQRECRIQPKTARQPKEADTFSQPGKVWSFANTNGNVHPGGLDYRGNIEAQAGSKGENEQQGGRDENRERVWVEPGAGCQIATDTTSNGEHRAQEFENGNRQGGERGRCDIDDIGEVPGQDGRADAANTNGQRGRSGNDQRQDAIHADARSKTHGSGNNFEGWPTQSPLCFRDDGFSARLDTKTLSFTGWRNESIKAAGNAIVPQVAHEIFKAIEQYERTR